MTSHLPIYVYLLDWQLFRALAAFISAFCGPLSTVSVVSNKIIELLDLKPMLHFAFP